MYIGIVCQLSWNLSFWGEYYSHLLLGVTSAMVVCLQLIKAFIDEAYSERYGIANNATVNSETTVVNTKGLSNDTTTPAGAISKNTQTLLWALTTTMFVPGGMIGSLTTGMIADKMGRFVRQITID